MANNLVLKIQKFHLNCPRETRSSPLLACARQACTRLLQRPSAAGRRLHQERRRAPPLSFADSRPLSPPAFAQASSLPCRTGAAGACVHYAGRLAAAALTAPETEHIRRQWVTASN